MAGAAKLELIRILATPITMIVERGSPKSLAAGAVMGGIVGFGTAYLMGWFLFAVTLIGILTGLFAAGLFFPAPPPPPAPTLESLGLPPAPGKIEHLRKYPAEGVTQCLAVCEHGLWAKRFLEDHESQAAEACVAKGQWPEGEIVPYSAIRHIEQHRFGVLSTVVAYEHGPSPGRLEILHASEAQFEEFSRELQEILSCNWEKEETEEDLLSAIMTPLVFLVIALVVAGGTLALAVFVPMKPGNPKFPFEWFWGISGSVVLALIAWIVFRWFIRPSYEILRIKRRS